MRLPSNRLATASAIALALSFAATSTACDRDGKKGPAATPAASGQAVPGQKPATVQPAPSAMAPGQPTAGPISTTVLPPGHPPVGGAAPPAGALPPGHPPTGANALPPGHPPTGANPKLPPGHPPTAGLPKPPSTTMPPAPQGRTVKVAGYSLQAPESWVRETPMSSMRAAQFKLPKQGSDPRDGVCTVIVAGGDVQANINRWRGQFKDNPEAKTESHTIAGVAVTLVRIQGTFMEQARPMAGGPGVARENYVMRAIIAPIGQRTLFVKAWGPTPTMDHFDGDFVAMAKSMTKTP